MPTERDRSQHSLRDAGASGSPEVDDRAGGVTWRAFLLALVVLLAFAPLVFFLEILYYSGSVVTGGPSAWPVSLLLVLAGLMGLGWFRRAGLSRRELLVVYAIVLVASPLGSATVLFYLLPKTLIYYHMARANPAWETAFLQHIPIWFTPTTELAREGFFEGKASVPWSLWALPLTAWLSFVVAAFAASVCILALLQRQWISRERLTFPLAQIPLEMVRGVARTPRAAAGRLTAGRTLWLGALVSFILSFLSMLSQRWPAMPSLPLGPTTIIPWQKVGPLAGLGAFYITLWPWLVAIVYIIPKEIAFSCWFFWLLRMAEHVVGIAAGTTPQLPEEVWGSDFPAPYYQATGAFIALGVWAIWIARDHLRIALRAIFSRRPGIADRDEPLPYRWALLGLVASTAWMVGFCCYAGCRISVGLAMAVVIVGLSVVWARIRAETALDASLLDGYQMMAAPLGTAGLRQAELVTIMTMRWATFPSPGMTFSACTMNVLESFKIGDAAGINPRRLLWAIGVGFLVALLAGTFVILTGIYHFGYFGTGGGAARDWPAMQSRWDGSFIFNSIMDPTPTDTRGLLAMAVGAAAVVVLGLGRLRFWWWPFHPVGYIVGHSWGMHWYLTAFLLGWAAKTLVIRYGGLRLYRATLPLAIGLIVGDLLNSTVWSIATLVTGGRLGPAALR